MLSLFQPLPLRRRPRRKLAAGPDFLAKNSAAKGVVTTTSGLEYFVVKSGAATGAHPTAADTATFDYEVKLLNGTTIDSSYERGEPLTGRVGDFVPGFTEALELMRPGDEWIVWVPPQLGYGAKDLVRSLATACCASGSPCTALRQPADPVPPPLSAGVLLFRERGGDTQVLLIKPGGPFWRNKDAGAWMIPKGAIEKGETAAEAALREFEEETGTRLTSVPFPLKKIRQAGGKWVEAFALEGDLDAAENHIERVRGRMAAPERSQCALPRSCRSEVDDVH